MSGETWTEYGVRVLGSPTFYDGFLTRYDADMWAGGLRASGLRAQVKGRTVTATPWLPVDTEPKP